MALTLIRGLPGSGKSTLAQQLCWHRDAKHLEADMFFTVLGEYRFDANRLREAHEWCQNQTRAHLTQNYDVVVSNTFTTIRELRPYFDIANEFGHVPQVIVCQGDFGNVHNVPAETLIRMRERFVYNIEELYVGAAAST